MSDYRTTLEMSLDSELKSDLALAHQYGKSNKSSWTKTISDTIGLRGAWEPLRSHPRGSRGGECLR
jgi:hypothetical protein